METEDLALAHSLRYMKFQTWLQQPGCGGRGVKEVYMEHKAISFEQKFELFREQWQPKVIAEMNDYQFKVVKLQGDFIWHDHRNTDETFIVIEGDLRIDFRDAAVHV